MGNDIAIILGYSNYRNAVINHVDDEDKLRTQIEYAGQKREVTIINESGLYSLILSSKLPSAKRFKHWDRVNKYFGVPTSGHGSLHKWRKAENIF